ncbi:hypothetical protein D3C72_1234800 [compost metagenome]
MALARATDAVCGIVAAISASRACGVPGTETSTLALGSCGEILAKSAGNWFPVTCVHGPVSIGARNQRPESST